MKIEMQDGEAFVIRIPRDLTLSRWSNSLYLSLLDNKLDSIENEFLKFSINTKSQKLMNDWNTNRFIRHSAINTVESRGETQIGHTTKCDISVVERAKRSYPYKTYKDYRDFYRSNPEIEYKYISSLLKALLAAGVPFSNKLIQDVYSELEYYSNNGRLYELTDSIGYSIFELIQQPNSLEYCTCGFSMTHLEEYYAEWIRLTKKEIRIPRYCLKLIESKDSFIQKVKAKYGMGYVLHYINKYHAVKELLKRHNIDEIKLYSTLPPGNERLGFTSCLNFDFDCRKAECFSDITDIFDLYISSMYNDILSEKLKKNDSKDKKDKSGNDYTNWEDLSIVYDVGVEYNARYFSNAPFANNTFILERYPDDSAS